VARPPSGGLGVGKASKGQAVPHFDRRETVHREIDLRQVGRGKVARGLMAAADRPSSAPSSDPSTTARRGVLRSGADRPTGLLPMRAARLRVDSVLVAHGGPARPSDPATSRVGRGEVVALPSDGPSRIEVATALPSDVRSTIEAVVNVPRIVVPGMAAAAAVTDLRFATAPRAPVGNGPSASPDPTLDGVRTARPHLRRHGPTIPATNRAADLEATVPWRVRAHGSVGDPVQIAGSGGARMRASVAREALRVPNGRPNPPGRVSSGRRCNGRPASWRGRVPTGRRTGNYVPR
jgi:hypothetical protein